MRQTIASKLTEIGHLQIAFQTYLAAAQHKAVEHALRALPAATTPRNHQKVTFNDFKSFRMTSAAQSPVTNDLTQDNAAPIRDRVATIRRIIDAGRALLADGGFQSFGVNAVARRAGCDKQLIYRYFGGLDGLVDAIGEDLVNWVEASVPADHGGRFILTYGELMERLIELYAGALRADPLVRRIIAWELSETSPHVKRMAEARAKGLAAWIERMRGSLTPPKGADPVAINAALIAAVQQLALSAEATGSFAGMPLKSDKDWQRALAAISRMARGAYA